MKPTPKPASQTSSAGKGNIDWQAMVPAMRPMMPIPAAMVLADRGEDYVLAAIETGALPFAWDIRGAASSRREIRIWRSGLLVWLANPLAALAGITTFPEEQTVLVSMLPHSRPELRGTELQRMFSCGHSHVINLITDGLLVSTTKARTGANGSPRITRASVLKFLQNRRVV